MQEIQTFDLYEASYYLIKHCQIVTVEAVDVDGKVNCRLTISGVAIHTLQAAYFSGEAEIKLFDFRRTYSQLHKVVGDAKRKYKLQMKHQKVAGGQL